MKLYKSYRNFNTLMHCSLFLLLLMCSALPLNAQPDDEGDGVDLGFTTPQDNGPDYSYTELPTVEKQVVVLYETFAQTYIKLYRGNPVSTTPIRYATNDQPNTLYSANIPDAGSVISNLPLDKDISIFSFDAMGNRQKIGEVSTHRYDEDVIPLSFDLYYPITNWLQEGANASGDLYTFVAGLSNVHQLEKTYFIQQFFYGGHPLPDAKAGNVPEKPETRLGEGCLCRPLQLTVLQNATPVGSQVWIDGENGNYMPDFVPGQNTTQYFGNNDRGKRWYAYSYEGAAKYQQVWIETARCVGGNNKMQMDNLSSNGPGAAAGPSAGNQAMLSYIFACIGVDDFRPDDCPCERGRQAEVCWKYAAQAEVTVDLRSGWCWNGRGIWGGATDVATVMYGYSDMTPATMPMPIAANTVMAGSGCSMNFDESKLAVNLFKTALYGYKTIKNLGVPDPTFSEQLWGLAYGYLAADAIKNLFSDDYVKTDGSCGGVVNPGGTLIEGCRKFDLYTNKRLVVALVSNSKLIVEGYGKYKGNARVLSSHALSGTIQRSDPDQSGENCCSNGHGVYSLSSFYPGMSTASAQSTVRGNFIGAGLNNIPGLNLNITGEFGYRGGGERPDCNLVVVDDRSDDDGGSDRSTEAVKKLSVLGHSVWLQNQTLGQDWQFSILDANGRIIHQANGSNSELQLFDFEGKDMPNGIYFLQLQDKNGVENMKIMKSN